MGIIYIFIFFWGTKSSVLLFLEIFLVGTISEILISSNMTEKKLIIKVLIVYPLFHHLPNWKGLTS